jgi:predicted dehydrogenase
MSAQVRVSVVGLGFMGRKWARALAEHPGAKVATVCDVDEATARRVGADLGCTWSTDPLDTATGRDSHGVVLCTPEHLHADMAVRAIESGRALAVEKPLAHDVPSAARIRDLAAEHGTPVLAAHVLRFETRYAAMRAAVEEGRIGTVQAIRTERIGILGDQTVLRGRTSVPLYYGVHELDLARWFCGDIEAVTAHRSDGVLRAAGYEVEDLYSVLLQFTSGAHGTSMLGWSLPDSTAGHGLSGLTVVGEQGYLQVQQDKTGLVGFGTQGPLPVDTWYAADVHGRMVGALANQVDHFVHVVRGDSTPLCTAADGFEAVRSSLAVEISATEHRTVQPAQL